MALLFLLSLTLCLFFVVDIIYVAAFVDIVVAAVCVVVDVVIVVGVVFSMVAVVCIFV